MQKMSLSGEQNQGPLKLVGRGQLTRHLMQLLLIVSAGGLRSCPQQSRPGMLFIVRDVPQIQQQYEINNGRKKHDLETVRIKFSSHKNWKNADVEKPL